MPTEAPTVQSLFGDFGVDVLTCARRAAAEYDVPILEDLHVEFTEHGRTHRISRARSEYKLLEILLGPDGPVWSLPILVPFFSRLIADKVISAPHNTADDLAAEVRPGGRLQPVANQIVAAILQLPRQLNKYRPSRQDVLDHFSPILYDRMSPSWRNTIRIDETIPLFHFESEIEDVMIGPYWKLVRFLPTAKSEIWNAFARGGFPRNDLWLGLNAFAAAKFCLVGSFEPTMPGAGEDAEHVITALRLTQPGNVGTAGVFRHPRYGASSWLLPYWYSNNIFGSLYLFDSTVLPETNRIRNSLHAAASRGQLRPYETALRRFHQVYDRTTLEDRVIDLTVALENMLMRGLKEEITYRFSLRAAALLAQHHDPARCQAVFKTIYMVRSAIVHNGCTLDTLPKATSLAVASLTGSSPIAFIELCEAYTRDVIKEYLSHAASGQTPEQVAARLDHSIVTGLRGLSLDAGEE